MLLLGLPDLLGLDESPACLIAVPGAGDGGDDHAYGVVCEGSGVVHCAVHSVWVRNCLYSWWLGAGGWGFVKFFFDGTVVAG